MTYQAAYDALTSDTGLWCLTALLSGALAMTGGLGVWGGIVALKRTARGLSWVGGRALRAAFPPRPLPPEPVPLAEEVANLALAIESGGKVDSGWVVAGLTRVAAGHEKATVRLAGPDGGVVGAVAGSVWSHGDDVTRHFTEDELAAIRAAAARRVAWYDAQEREAARWQATGGA